jgi:hypothetical protein
MSGSYWTDIQEAYELLDLSSILPPDGNIQNYLHTFKGAQDPSVDDNTVISSEAWSDYEPPQPYLKNTTRFLQFQQSHVISSPNMPIGETSYVSTNDDPDNPDGYTWGSMSYAQNAMWPYSSDQYSGISKKGAYYAGAFTTTPPEGSFKLTNNFKCQAMNFWATDNNQEDGNPILRHKIFDPNGNGYIMHASGVESADEIAQAFEEAVLPDGWIKKSVVLKKNLILEPAMGEGGDYGIYNYNLIRDSADNSYHQFKWSDNGVLVNSKVEGMIGWGGRGDNLITGDHAGSEGSKDTIHGAQGDDRLFAGLKSDVLWGDHGDDVLRGNGGSDSLNGGAGKDRLIGGRAADSLAGGDGDDYLYGRSGDDTLNGGDGDDRLVGGSGADRYQLSGGKDRVKGFSPADGDRVVSEAVEIVARQRGENLLLISGDQSLVLVGVGDLSLGDVLLPM